MLPAAVTYDCKLHKSPAIVTRICMGPEAVADSCNLQQ